VTNRKKKSSLGFMGIGWVFVIFPFLAGCAPSARYCGPSELRNGAVCYDGIDFGRSSDPLYRAGVRDGCETGKGYFRKNYRYSGTSEAYRQGWTKGRATCRPPGWIEDPAKRDTGMHHPDPTVSRADRHRREEERRRVIRAYPETRPHTTQHFDTDSPEILSYD